MKALLNARIAAKLGSRPEHFHPTGVAELLRPPRDPKAGSLKPAFVWPPAPPPAWRSEHGT
ncbi:hypothetical protein AB4144_39890, partial [Rhizobiaceae sp. 2RAB30]